MCHRCNETKAALEHAIVAALKLAKLTSRDMAVGFIEEALVITPAGTARFDVEVAVVRVSSTAEELKAQVKAFMVDMSRMSQAHGDVRATSTIDSSYVN